MKNTLSIPSMINGIIIDTYFLVCSSMYSLYRHMSVFIVSEELRSNLGVSGL